MSFGTLTRFLLPGVVALSCASSSVQAAAQLTTDDAAIRAQAKQFEDAFCAGDAHAIAQLWTPGATYLSDTGRQYKGRTAIEELYTRLFGEIGQQNLKLQIDSITFPAPNVAIEVGSAMLTKGGTCARYTAVHEKTDSGWLMSNVTETSCAAREPVAADLHALDWLVGKWTASGPRGSVPLEAAFDANHNFLSVRFLTATTPAATESSQIIGLDRSSGRISSWHFDSNGGYGRGYWMPHGNDWIILGFGVENGGRVGRASYIIHKVDDNTFTWRSLQRSLDGKRLPSSSEVKVVRSI